MRRNFVVARSRIVARSGTMPMNQNNKEIVKYVLTANTSHNSGLRNCGHIDIALGYGSVQKITQIRPTWMVGNKRAQMTAKMVIASAARLMLVRQFCRNRYKMAEISVPAWPMPTQNTKFVMSHAQPTRLFNPH